MLRLESETHFDLSRFTLFTDAVVAIAITLLALELSVPETENFSFGNIFEAWPHFLAFLLSFIIIGVFWKIHYQFFTYIGKVDERMIGLNMMWLFGIILLPFSTNLMSEHLLNGPATIFYSANVFFVSFIQNLIWDYACDTFKFYPGNKTQRTTQSLLKENVSQKTEMFFRLACNIHWINAAIALVVAFFSPLLAMLILFTRIILFRSTAVQWIERSLRKQRGKQGSDEKKDTNSPTE